MGNAVGRAIKICMMIVSTIILARLLGAEGLGVYTLAIAGIRIATIPVVEGSARICEREISGSIAMAQGALARASLRFGIAASSVMFLILVTTLLTVMAYQDQDHISVQVIVLLLVVDLISATLRGIARGEGRTSDVAFSENIRAALMPVGLLLYYSFTDGLTPDVALIIHGLAGLVAIPVLLWISIAHWPRGLPRDAGKVNFRLWAWESAQFMLLGAVQASLHQVGFIVLGVTATLEDVGIFRIATRIFTLLTFFPLVIRSAVGPRIPMLWRSGKHTELQDEVRILGALGFCLVLFSTLVFLLIGEWFLGVLISDQMRASFMSAAILSLAALAVAFGGLSGRMLKMAGFQLWVTTGAVIALGMAGGLGWVLSTEYGANGCAVAFVAAILTSQTIDYISCRTQMRIDPIPRLLTFRSLLFRLKSKIGPNTT